MDSRKRLPVQTFHQNPLKCRKGEVIMSTNHRLLLVPMIVRNQREERRDTSWSSREGLLQEGEQKEAVITGIQAKMQLSVRAGREVEAENTGIKLSTVTEINGWVVCLKAAMIESFLVVLVKILPT